MQHLSQVRRHIEFTTKENEAVRDRLAVLTTHCGAITSFSPTHSFQKFHSFCLEFVCLLFLLLLFLCVS